MASISSSLEDSTEFCPHLSAKVRSCPLSATPLCFILVREIEANKTKNFSKEALVTPQKKQNNFWTALLLMGLCTVPRMAFAAPAWDSALETIVGYVTGSTARYIAILAVVGFGFAAFVGRISWKRALEIVVAIAVVFGAAKIVDMFAGSGTP